MKQRQFEPNYRSSLGLKQSHAITSMPVGALLDCQNINLDGLGGKSTRKGYEPLFRVSGNAKVQSLLDYKKADGTQQVLAYAGTAIVKQNGATSTNVRTGLTSATPWEWLVYHDRVFGVNGVDTSWRYDGTNSYKISLTKPSTPGASVVAGGALPVGTFYYVVTNYDSVTGYESEPNQTPDNTATSATTSGGNLTVRLTGLPTAAPSGESSTHFRLYRKGPSETVFTRVATVAYSGSTYDDTGLATGTVEVEYDDGQLDNGHPTHPQSRLIAECFNRLFMVDESDRTVLAFSRINRPHAFPSANFFYIGRQDGHPILTISKHNNMLVIGKRNGVWVLSEDPSANGEPIKISSTGVQNSRLAVTADQVVVRLSPSGFYRSAPTDFSLSDLREGYIGSDVQVDEVALNYASNDMHAVSFRSDKQQHVYFMAPNSSDYSTTVWVYDWGVSQTGEWVKYKLNTDVYCTAEHLTSGKMELLVGDGYGGVYIWNRGSSDGGASDLDNTELNGTATGATSTTLTDSAQNWVVDELVGMVVEIVDGAGAGQRRRITANTATEITVAAWTTNPSTSSVYAIGAIDSFAEEFWNAADQPQMLKRLRWITPFVRQTGASDIEISFRKDFRSGTDNQVTFELSTSDSESLWGSMVWGTDVWGSPSSTLRRVFHETKYRYYSVKYRQRKSGFRMFWDGHGSCFQFLHDKTGLGL